MSDMSSRLGLSELAGNFTIMCCIVLSMVTIEGSPRRSHIFFDSDGRRFHFRMIVDNSSPPFAITFLKVILPEALRTMVVFLVVLAALAFIACIFSCFHLRPMITETLVLDQLGCSSMIRLYWKRQKETQSRMRSDLALGLAMALVFGMGVPSTFLVGICSAGMSGTLLSSASSEGGLRPVVLALDLFLISRGTRSSCILLGVPMGSFCLQYLKSYSSMNLLLCAMVMASHSLMITWIISDSLTFLEEALSSWYLFLENSRYALLIYLSLGFMATLCIFKY